MFPSQKRSKDGRSFSVRVDETDNLADLTNSLLQDVRSQNQRQDMQDQKVPTSLALPCSYFHFPLPEQ